MIGIVRGYEIKASPESSDLSILLQVEIDDPEDLQTVEYFSRNGDQSIPLIDSRVSIFEAGPNYKIAIAADDGILPDSSVGEGDKKIYSALRTAASSEFESDKISIQSFIKLLKTGEISIQATDGNDVVKLLGLINLLNTGAIKINSTDSGGSEQATIDLTDSGNLQFNGTGDFAVRYNELLSGLQNKDANINTELGKIATAIGNLGGSYIPGTISTDISDAKIDSIEVPSP